MPADPPVLAPDVPPPVVLVPVVEVPVVVDVLEPDFERFDLFFFAWPGGVPPPRPGLISLA